MCVIILWFVLALLMAIVTGYFIDFGRKDRGAKSVTKKRKVKK